MKRLVVILLYSLVCATQVGLKLVKLLLGFLIDIVFERRQVFLNSRHPLDMVEMHVVVAIDLLLGLLLLVSEVQYRLSCGLIVTLLLLKLEGDLVRKLQMSPCQLVILGTLAVPESPLFVLEG